MPAGRPIAAMSCAACLVFCLSGSVRADVGWQSDFAVAQREAVRSDRPMLLHFFAEWCGPCKKMDREVFSPGFLNVINQHLVAVKLDVDHHRALAQRFGVASVPTDLFLTPDGRVLGEMNGFRPGDDYLRRVAAIESQYDRLKSYNFARSDARIPLAAVNDGDKGPRLPTLESPEPVQVDIKPSGSPGPVIKPRSDGSILLGLKGHSPVALYESRKWVKGNKQFAWEHQGLTYFMSSSEELAKFRERAEQYAPKLLGCDPVLYYDEQRAVPGSTQFAAFFDESLYLFTSAATRSKFREHPEDYTRRRTVLLIDELEGILR